MNEVFREIYETNGWKNNESVSGRGSTLKETATIREELPLLFHSLDFPTVLDIPCGDFYWFEKMWKDEASLWISKYIGADIVPELIEENKKKYLNILGVEFVVLDAATDELPKVDVIFCRDMLGHLSNWEVHRVLDNFKKSGSSWLVATTFPGRQTAGNIRTGEWRPIDLDHWWGLPKPTLIINERCTEGDGKFADKSLGLWRLNGKITNRT